MLYLLLHSHRYSSSSSIFHVVYTWDTIKFAKPLRIHKANRLQRTTKSFIECILTFDSVSNESKQLLSVACFPSNVLQPVSLHVYHLSLDASHTFCVSPYSFIFKSNVTWLFSAFRLIIHHPYSLQPRTKTI